MQAGFPLVFHNISAMTNFYLSFLTKNIMRKIYTTMLFFITNLNVFAQAPVWFNTDTSSAPIIDVVGMVKDSSENIYVAAMNTLGEIVFDKYDSAGTRLFEKHTKVGLFTTPKDIVISDSGFIFIGGFCENFTGTHDYCIIKYNSSGDTLWSHVYDYPVLFSADELSDITIDESGNTYATGSSQGDFLTLKLNTNGDTAWTARLDLGNFETAHAIGLDVFNNVWILGISSSGMGTTNHIAKYDSNGQLLFVDTIGLNTTESKNIFLPDTNGNMYVAGNFGSVATNSDFVVKKMDNSGSVVWTFNYNVLNSNRIDELKGIAFDSNGDLLITGDSYGMGVYVTATLKINPSGVLLWDTVKSVTGASVQSMDIATNSNDNIFISGKYGAFGFVTKYDSSGNEQWTMVDSTNIGNGEIKRIVTGTSQSVYSCGKMRLTGSNDPRSAALKYFDASLITSELENHTEIKDLEITPNPSTGIFTIILPEKHNDILFECYNAQGELITREKYADTNKIFLEIKRDAGVYFGKIKADEKFFSPLKLVKL